MTFLMIVKVSMHSAAGVMRCEEQPTVMGKAREDRQREQAARNAKS